MFLMAAGRRPVFWGLALSSAILLFVALTYSFLSPHDSIHSDLKQINNIIPLPSRVPVCDVWESQDPSWHRHITSAIPANESALHSPHLGLAEVMNGPSDSAMHRCVPASERLGPFGHSSGQHHYPDRPWSSLRWGELQNRCARSHITAAEPDLPMPTRLQRPYDGLDETLNSTRLDNLRSGRSAVVLRTWDGFQYDSNQKAWLRTLATELALDTGGRFQLFLLVDVKDSSLDLHEQNVYAGVLERSVPEEFRDMTLLWNENLVREWFPKVNTYTAQDQMYQALQIFSFTFPEFDYVWQLEMDARFTGHVADMLESTALWAEGQPRKNLWERNARWYVSGLWDNYASFSAAVDRQLEDKITIWGPPPGAHQYVQPQGPTPPDRSHRTWGVGEPPDLITFSPMIDPVGTNWTYEHTVGFDPPLDLPRRMAIVSMTRTSRRLLRLISAEQRATGSWVVSESTPETWSFLHGLKAVYAPHLLAFNLGEHETMSPQELDRVIHKGPFWSLAGGERAGFLWCGNEVGIPEQRWLKASYFYWAGDAPNVWWDYTNGTCTHALLLHPVKQD